MTGGKHTTPLQQSPHPTPPQHRPVGATPGALKNSVMCACDSRMRWSSRDSRTGTAARSTSSIALSAPPAPPMKLRFPTPTARERRKNGAARVWCPEASGTSLRGSPVVFATCIFTNHTSIDALLTSASAKNTASKVQHPALSSHSLPQSPTCVFCSPVCDRDPDQRPRGPESVL